MNSFHSHVVLTPCSSPGCKASHLVMMPTVRRPCGSAPLAMRKTSWFARLLRASMTALEVFSNVLTIYKSFIQNDGALISHIRLDKSPNDGKILRGLILGGVYLTSVSPHRRCLCSCYCEKALAHRQRSDDDALDQKARSCPWRTVNPCEEQPIEVSIVFGCSSGPHTLSKMEANSSELSSWPSILSSNARRCCFWASSPLAIGPGMIETFTEAS